MRAAPCALHVLRRPSTARLPYLVCDTLYVCQTTEERASAERRARSTVCRLGVGSGAPLPPHAPAGSPDQLNGPGRARRRLRRQPPGFEGAETSWAGPAGTAAGRHKIPAGAARPRRAAAGPCLGPGLAGHLEITFPSQSVGSLHAIARRPQQRGSPGMAAVAPQGASGAPPRRFRLGARQPPLPPGRRWLPPVEEPQSRERDSERSSESESLEQRKTACRWCQ
jgi:hypothetical protein